jgi:surface polysaccharide O-acyltransferase-like enzyme
MLMSSFLFSRKKPTKDRVIDRIKKLSCLHLFWSACWVLYSKSRPEHNFLGVLEFIIRGGGWQFYTFSVLILLTPLDWIAYHLSQRAKWGMLGIAMSVVLGVFWWNISGQKWLIKSYYWLPLNYVAMPFAGALLAPKISAIQTSGRTCSKLVVLCVVIGAAFACLEWSFAAEVPIGISGARAWLPKASRLSIQFFAVSMIIGGLFVKNKPGRIITLLARNSLGVYCVHGFFVSLIMKINSGLSEILQAPIASIICLVVLLIVCTFTSELLRMIFKERLV